MTAADLQRDVASLPRLLKPLAAPRARWWVAGVALLLVSPSLATGLLLDDHVFAVLLQGESGGKAISGFHAHPLLLFSFTSGDPGDIHALIDQGALLPWWSDPRHLNAFFRPLSSLSHAIDFALWPDAPWLMHLHSMLWFAALLLVVARVHRGLVQETTETGIVAALAFALFALDDAHAMTVTWIANRNALISATLAFPALLCHYRFVCGGDRKSAFLGPLWFALGLCAGETAVAVFGYVLSCALVLDRKPLATRVFRLWPYLLLLGAWRLITVGLGMGSRGSGAYHNPLQEPLGFALAWIDHLPVLLSAQLALPLADVAFWGASEAHVYLWLLSVASLAVIALLWARHAPRDRIALFWALSLGLSASVVAASVPGERLLLVPGVAGAALVASLLSSLGKAVAAGPDRFARAGLWGLLLIHLLAGPIGLPLRVQGLNLLGRALARADRSLPSEPARQDETWIVLNAPFDVMVSYVQLARAGRGQARPAHLYWLATASSELEVRGVDRRTLRVTPEAGFLRSAPERHYRGDPRALSIGSQVELSEMTAIVREVTEDGRPAAVDFQFAAALDAPRYRFFRFERGRFVECAAPPPGTELTFARQDFFRVLLTELQRAAIGG